MKRSIYRDILKVNALRDIQNHASNARGFSLVELLVASAIGLVVLGAMYSVFTFQNKTFNTQELIVEMQQNVRSAMDIMVDEIQMAGCNRGTSNLPGISSPSGSSIRFTQDLNGDADVSDDNEDITYSYNAGQKCVTRQNAGGNALTFAENIESLVFSYYDSTGSEITDPAANISKIRMTKLRIVGKTAGSDISNDPGHIYRNFTLESYVTLRNIAY